jgi:hypothetical protein
MNCSTDAVCRINYTDGLTRHFINLSDVQPLAQCVRTSVYIVQATNRISIVFSSHKAKADNDDDDEIGVLEKF